MDEKETGFIEQSSINPNYISPESEEHDVDVRNYLLAILNRRWMILAVTALVVLAVAIYSFLQTPVYQSKVVLEIDVPGTYVFPSDPAATPFYWRNVESFMNTQFRLLKGKSLAKRVAERLNLTLADLKTVGLKDNKKPSSDRTKKGAEIDAVATQLLGMVDVTPVRETNLCEVVFNTPNPQLSMTLANAWAQEYVTHRLDSMQEYTQNAEDLLTEQVKFLQQEIAQKEKLLHDYSLEKQIVKPDKTLSMASYAVTDLNSALLVATRDRISAQVRYQALKSTSRGAIPEVAAHSVVQQLRSQYTDLERVYTEKSKTYKPDYPEMIRLRAEMEQLRRTLESQISKASEEVLDTARSEYQQAVSQERALQNQLNVAKRQSVEAGGKEFTYDQILMEIENKKQLLTLLLQRQNQTDVSAQGQEKNVTTTRIMEYAELPKDIYEPNIGKNLIFSLIAGFVAGIALSLLLEFFDRTIKSPDDVERFVHLPFLGIVPRYSLVEGNGHNAGSRELVRKKATEFAVDRYAKDLLSAIDPMSPASEAIKTVRTSLLLAFPEAPPRSILITSSRAREGKTFIACNLAIALTQLEKRVVLIDADMRNPRIHRVWDIHNDTGLSIYLTSDVPVASVLRPTSLSYLSLISSGPKTPRPAELLASARFKAMMQQLEKEFDFVILDSPPVLPVADSVILASRAKSVVLVIHGGTTARDVVRLAKKKLSASNPVIIGTVVNGIDFANPYYYYRYYSHYNYPYYGESSPPADTKT